MRKCHAVGKIAKIHECISSWFEKKILQWQKHCITRSIYMYMYIYNMYICIYLYICIIYNLYIECFRNICTNFGSEFPAPATRKKKLMQTRVRKCAWSFSYNKKKISIDKNKLSYFASNRYSTFNSHIASSVMNPELNCSASHTSRNKCWKDVLHLLECTHGRVGSWTLAKVSRMYEGISIRLYEPFSPC